MDSLPLPVMGSALIGPWGRDDVINGQYFSWTLNTRVMRAESVVAFQPWILSAAFQQQRVASVRRTSMTLLAAWAELVEASLTLNL